jgi:hypothetical protein
MKRAATPLLIPALGALLLAGAACDSRGRETPPASSGAAADETPLPLAQGSGGEPALPAPGVAEIWRTARGWTALANRAPRFAVLRQVADAAGVGLEVAPDMMPPEGSVTLRVADVPIETILQSVLEGVAYALHYEPDPSTRAPVLTRVALTGLAVGGDASAEQATDGLAPAHPGDETPPTIVSLDRLRDPDPEIRASAAEWIPLEPGSFSTLADLLRNDPSAGVRAAAAATLGDAMNKPEEREAEAALLQALHDEDPEVVLAALGALESVGDAGTARGLAFLLEHPTAEVRKAAADTIEWLED